jgi:hypothetical protein
MRNTRLFYFCVLMTAIAIFFLPSRDRISARPQSGPNMNIKGDDIGGVVTSSKGPEAGVWVIAETADTPTKLVKIVVTDDSGRYLVPELPKGTYKVWVRGYGLVDSQPVKSEPGKMVNLTAVLAPDARAAAQYYPAEYWFAMVKLPPKSDFPGTGDAGNGISDKLVSQGAWVDMMKTNSCESCHQLGDKATRELPASLGHFDSSVDGWKRRIASSQIGLQMITAMGRFGSDRGLNMFASWTDRVVAGDLPKQAPPRPQGAERNVVITEWDWSTPREYFHDEIVTDRRNPAMNANGLVYGVHEYSSDSLTVLDPVRNSTVQIPIPVQDQDVPYPGAAPHREMYPSPYFGEQLPWDAKASAHSLMMDASGRIWMTATFRKAPNPAFCKAGSDLPSAKLFPMERNTHQATVYDPETKKFGFVDLCFGTQHLMFAEDANNTLWFSNPIGDVIGWLDTKKWDETHDASKSQGWTALVVDTNGNGKRDEDYTQPGQPQDPKKDMRLRPAFYAINWSPADGSIWGTVNGYPGKLVRLALGPNPPATTLAEVYEPPLNNPKAPIQGWGVHGGDIDRDGVYWAPLSSGQLASFDRRKCKGPLNGPLATGQQCPEGWTLYPMPGPNFEGTDIPAGSNYYAWVDQFDTLGLGKGVPISTGNGSDSMLALLANEKKFVNMRVPYPMGFYAKSLDGRIDDAKAGWKGRGVWSTYSTRTLQHVEPIGKDVVSKVVKFQIRPDPLAN